MLTFARPGAATTALLLHTGTLRSNLVQGVPAQMADLQDTIVAPTATATSETLLGYVPPDAAVITAAGWDEIYVDLQPTLNYALSVGSTSATTLEALRQVAASDRPYWIVVRCDGYGYATSAAGAIQAALAVAQWGYDTASSILARGRLRGFAFLAPDLNVRFSDGSVITRLMQNQLVQKCWSLSTSASLVTSRPGDQTCLVAPSFSTDAAHVNPNSGMAQPWPIVGTNPAQRDRIVALYPLVQSTELVPAVILGMMAGVIGSRGRDAGFPLNMDVALVLQPDETLLTSDGVGGTSGNIAWLQRVLAFGAALGATSLGVTSTTYVVPADALMPADAGVNTTGAVRVGVRDGIVSVAYADATGATPEIVRTFDASFQETTVAVG